jgi:hypothetical protein
MILLVEHDSGIDGWDSRHTIVAVYDNKDRVLDDLRDAGYTFKEGTGVFSRYRHQDPAKRYTMGEISYSLTDGLDLNNYDFPHK